MQKEDVLAYVRPKPLLHCLSVPYARLFCSSLDQGNRRDRAILSLHGSKGEPEGMCHHLQAQCYNT